MLGPPGGVCNPSCAYVIPLIHAPTAFSFLYFQLEIEFTFPLHLHPAKRQGPESTTFQYVLVRLQL